jgi:bifunctional DNase/RNase
VLHGRVEQVAITGRTNLGYHATLSVAVDGRREEVDARPTDALLLGLRTGKPMLISEEILDREGVAADRLIEKLPSREVESEVMAPGEWRSLSAEILQALYRPPKPK